QRYCVQCGQRRGQSQLPVAQPVAASAPRRESRMPRMSQNAALIAGVGVLLLAMGVGVLIGRSGQKSGSAAAAPQIVTVGGLSALERRRDQLRARVAELQWDLGGLVYEMATRDHIRVDTLVRRAAVLQEADAELNEVERILRTEQTGAAGSCTTCGAPHSS